MLAPKELTHDADASHEGSATAGSLKFARSNSDWNKNIGVRPYRASESGVKQRDGSALLARQAGDSISVPLWPDPAVRNRHLMGMVGWPVAETTGQPESE